MYLGTASLEVFQLAAHHFHGVKSTTTRPQGWTQWAPVAICILHQHERTLRTRAPGLPVRWSAGASAGLPGLGPDGRDQWQHPVSTRMPLMVPWQGPPGEPEAPRAQPLQQTSFVPALANLSRETPLSPRLLVEANSGSCCGASPYTHTHPALPVAAGGRDSGDTSAGWMVWMLRGPKVTSHSTSYSPPLSHAIRYPPPLHGFGKDDTNSKAATGIDGFPGSSGA